MSTALKSIRGSITADGSDIVTAGSFNGYLPTDLADGDDDLLAVFLVAWGTISWMDKLSVCIRQYLELIDISDTPTIQWT